MIIAAHSRVSCVALIAATMLGVAMPAMAHHSFAMFDQEKTATLTGTYVHSHGVHQLFSTVLNPGALAPQYQFESGGVFNQNQFIVNFNVRAGTRLTIFSFYMFSHANSDTAGANSFASDPGNPGRRALSGT